MPGVRFRCATCGEEHEGVPAIGFAFPIQYMDVPAAQRKRRVRLEGDTCVIDDQRFFVRGCLEIPVRRSRTPFVWGVWVRVSRTSFRQFQRLAGVADRSHHGPFAGRLCSPPRPYPDSLNLKAKVHLRDAGIRALIELEASDHPLAVEQRLGITRRRVSEIISLMMHHSSRLAETVVRSTSGRRATPLTIDQILTALASVAPWQARAMCAAAAERAAPLFRRLGRPESQPTFEAALDGVWAAVRSGGGGLLKRSLRRLPEARQDDSHNPEYHASQTLRVLFHALDTSSTKGGAKAPRCLEAIASLCDGIDTMLTASPGQTFRYDPKHPPPPGELESHELGAQAEMLESLRQASAPDTGLIDSLRRRARERASIYESVVSRLISSHAVLKARAVDQAGTRFPS
jgi:hypothetical protein